MYSQYLLSLAFDLLFHHICKVVSLIFLYIYFLLLFLILLKSYNQIADIVKKAEIINESIGISEYEEKDKNANLICAKAADELLTISNITASFVIGNSGDKICISGRSIGDINVQIILEKLRRRRSYYSCRSTIRGNDNR